MKDFMDEKELESDLEATDEETYAEEELEDVEENSAQTIKKIKAQLKACEAEKMALLEDLQRAKADFLNGKRRLEEERVRDKERAVASLIEKLLPMCDSFYMATSNKEAWNAIDETWRKGIESIYTQLQGILASYDVKEVTPIGEEFDPALHDAVATLPVDSKDMNHKIIGVIQNGFIRNTGGKDMLIRPARVTIGEYSE